MAAPYHCAHFLLSSDFNLLLIPTNVWGRHDRTRVNYERNSKKNLKTIKKSWEFANLTLFTVSMAAAGTSSVRVSEAHEKLSVMMAAEDHFHSGSPCNSTLITHLSVMMAAEDHFHSENFFFSELQPPSHRHHRGSLRDPNPGKN